MNSPTTPVMYPNFIQYSAVLLHSFVYLFLWIISTPFLIYCLYTGFLRYAAIIYLIFFYLDRNSSSTGRKRPWYPQFYPEAFNQYFDTKLIATCPLRRGTNYILGIHPHGATGFATNIFFEKSAFSKVFGKRRYFFAIHKLFFFIPFLREYSLQFHAIEASEENLLKKLTDDDVIIGLCVGGAYESLLSRPGRYRLVLRGRKGFCRLALRSGAALLPSFSFGEVEIWESFERGRRFKNCQWFAYKRFGYPLLSLGSLPRKVPLRVVLGRPIYVDKVENPTQEEVDRLHEVYVKAVEEIFYKFKGVYLENPDVPLVIK